MEHHTADAPQLDLLDGEFQVFLRRNTQHDEMARFLGLLKAAAGFQTGVADLDDLIGKRNIRANQDVGVARRRLSLRHDWVHRSQ